MTLRTPQAVNQFEVEGMTIEDTLYGAANEFKETGASARVVVLGSLHLDIMVHAPDRPKKGETLPGSAWGYKAGGKGKPSGGRRPVRRSGVDGRQGGRR